MTAILPAVTITTAVSGSVGQTFCARNPGFANLGIQAKFVYGSGGTSATAYVQTSIDDGVTWIDIASLQFTTSSATKVVNLTSGTPITTPATPTDGSLTANTVVNGVIGNRYRVKYTTVGTYAGGTTLSVHMNGVRLDEF